VSEGKRQKYQWSNHYGMTNKMRRIQLQKYTLNNQQGKLAL
jgi:hypothetical protein